MNSIFADDLHERYPRLFSHFWPPHHAIEGSNALTRKLWLHLAHKYSSVQEASKGRIGAPALTTLPLLADTVPRTDLIAIACATLDPGGAERQAAYTAWGLQRRGHPVAVVGYDEHRAFESEYFAPFLLNAGVPLYNAALDLTNIGEAAPNEQLIWEEEELRGEALPLELGRMLNRYFRFFMRLRPGVVHAWLDYTNTVVGLAALWAGVPRVVLGLRNANPMHLPLYQPFFRPFYRLLISDQRTKLVANSNFGAENYAQWLGIDRASITVIPNGISGAFDQNAAAMDSSTSLPDETSPLILGVFRLYFEKDPLLFVRVAARVLKSIPKARFRILGDGPLRDAVMKEARRLGISDKLEILGRVSDVSLHMRQSSLLLHTSLFEGLPNALIEAQLAGLPVVTTNAGGACETLEPNVTGVVLDTRSARQIAEAVVNCLSSPAWLASARARAPEWISEHFSLEKMLANTLAVYAGSSREEPNSGDAI